MAPLKVLVSGAGIAGPGLAFWLSRMVREIDITIIERNPVLRASGHQVDFRGQGIALIKKMGIEEAVRAVVCTEPGTRFIDQNGKSKAYFPVNTSGKGNQSMTSAYEIMRGDLVQILYDATKHLKGVRYIFGCQIESLTQDEVHTPGSRAHVLFSNGRRDDYDLVVGADGIGSPTRKLMLGSSFPDPCHDLGVHACFFTAPSRPDDSNEWQACHMPGGRLLMTRKDRPENIRVTFIVRGGCEELHAADRSANMAEQKRAWAEMFKGTEGVLMERFLADLLDSREADDIYTQHLNQIRLPEGSWSRGRVVLLGDAAYCLTPLGGGLGSTAALIGAYVLAGEVSKRWNENGDIPNPLDQAVKEYERLVRPFITDAQKVSPHIINMVLPQTKWGVWSLQTAAGFASAIRIEKLFSWLGGEEKHEELGFPDYPQLSKTHRKSEI